MEKKVYNFVQKNILMINIHQVEIFSIQILIFRFFYSGIFNVWQMKSLSPLYFSSMLWKPIVYQTTDRTVERNTLMQMYDLKNLLSSRSFTDQGIFQSLYTVPYISAFNISLGRQNDGLKNFFFFFFFFFITFFFYLRFFY